MQSLFSEALSLYPVSRIANLEHKYFGANPCKDLETIVAFSFHAGALDFSILRVQTGNQRLHRSLKMSKNGLL